MRVIIATIKSWNIENAERLRKKYVGEHEILVLTDRKELCLEQLGTFKPDFIFFPHWSYIIPPEIFEKYICVVFHMTDLPYGRGGSPLQNLIVRGNTKTKISAIRVEQEVDAGPIYMKEEVSLEGNAREIFEKISHIIFDRMIPRFWEEHLEPKEQQGEPVFFKRRTPQESELKPGQSLIEIYDYIRMLDAEGYPNAFLDFGVYRLSFQNAKLSDGRLSANVIWEERH